MLEGDSSSSRGYGVMERQRGESVPIIFVDINVSEKPNCCCLVCCSCKQPYQVGNHILVWGEGVGQSFPKTCLLGPDWFCSLLTLLLLLFPTILWLQRVAFPFSVYLGSAGTASLVLTLWFFLRTACSDPGIVPKQQRLGVDENSEDIPCSKCNVYRPIGTIHCTSCDVCITHLDHHCPWTGKCIGKANLRDFRFFTTLIFVHILVVFGGYIYAVLKG